jgi:hypothetical protein
MSSKKILVLNYIDSGIAPFFGENRQNQISLVDSPHALVSRAIAENYEILVIAFRYNKPNFNETDRRILNRHYEMVYKNDLYHIFKKFK